MEKWLREKRKLETKHLNNLQISKPFHQFIHKEIILLNKDITHNIKTQIITHIINNQIKDIIHKETIHLNNLTTIKTDLILNNLTITQMHMEIKIQQMHNLKM